MPELLLKGFQESFRGKMSFLPCVTVGFGCCLTVSRAKRRPRSDGGVRVAYSLPR
jgi:hypothetical protein